MDALFDPVIEMTRIEDDTFTFRKGESDHENHLVNVLDAAWKNNIRFNPDKFQFKVPEPSFFGMKWRAEGFKVDNSKVQSMVNIEPAKDVKSLQSFLGMVNYLNQFSPILGCQEIAIIPRNGELS